MSRERRRALLSIKPQRRTGKPQGFVILCFLRAARDVTFHLLHTYISAPRPNQLTAHIQIKILIEKPFPDAIEFLRDAWKKDIRKQNQTIPNTVRPSQQRQAKIDVKGRRVGEPKWTREARRLLHRDTLPSHADRGSGRRRSAS